MGFYKETINFIGKREFDKAYKSLNNSLSRKFFNEIFVLAYESNNLTYYDFIKYIIEVYDDSSEMNLFASELMTQALNTKPNSYEIGFNHAIKAIELNPNNIELKEYILLFNQLSNNILDNKEAKKIATEILKLKPDSKAALQILNQ